MNILERYNIIIIVVVVVIIIELARF